MSAAVDGIRRQLDSAVRMGLMTELDADEVADSIDCVVRLCQRRVITERLAAHLIDTMAEKKALEWRAKHPVWRPRTH